MKSNISPEQIVQYQQEGFLVIDEFLNPAELETWQVAVDSAIARRKGYKLPGRESVYGKGDETEKEYYDKVFDQLINLWQDNPEIRTLMLDPRIGSMAAALAQVNAVRVWHDQALVKKPWGNPTSWHLDTPYWSFSDRRALSIWISLDDATLENGCLFFIPGSHKSTTFENPGIGKNMDAIFGVYPQFKNTKAFAATMKAGDCSFHCGLTIHGAHANMTPGQRRAMTCAFMPDGAVFNGIPNILSDEQIAGLKIGTVLNDPDQNPLV